MGGPHGHRLHFHGHSPVHRARPQVKIAGLVVFMIAVVATPVHVVPVIAAYGAVLVSLVTLSRVPWRFILPRLVIETPVLVFAALLPFLAAGPTVQVLGVSVSEPGLTAAGGLVVKATLGVGASLLLAATTEPGDLLGGLERLRVPAQLVQIMAFMVRYLDVVSDELRRMRTASESRGFSATDPRHWPVIGRTAGALFIRSYERGERVHLAMVSRGYDGSLRR